MSGTSEPPTVGRGGHSTRAAASAGDAEAVRVRCEYCGASYETSTPSDVVERIRRCAECGQRALVIEPIAAKPAGTIGADDSAGRARQISVEPDRHLVHFYRDDAELAAQVAAYLANALAEGAAAIVVAVEPHVQAIEDELTARGVAISAAIDEERLIILDASVALAESMVNGKISRRAFRRFVTRVVRRAHGGGQPVRLYAEMVDLLWRSGNVSGAIALERLWNELIDELGFSLLCAYHSEVTAEPDHRHAVDEVCRLHASVTRAPSPLLGDRDGS